MTVIKQQTKPTRQLSERQRRLIQLLADGRGFTEAMLAAGYSRYTACTQQRRARMKPEIQRALIKARIAKGQYVTPEERAFVGNIGKV